MRNERGCRVYDLMVDVVELWFRDYGVAAPPGAWDDLITRLSKCDRDLQKRYECQRVRDVCQK